MDWVIGIEMHFRIGIDILHFLICHLINSGFVLASAKVWIHNDSLYPHKLQNIVVSGIVVEIMLSVIHNAFFLKC